MNVSLKKIFMLTLGSLALLALLFSYLYPFHLFPWLTFYNEWLFAVFVGLSLAWLIGLGNFVLPDIRVWVLFLLLIVLHFFFLNNMGSMQTTLFWIYLCFFVVSGFSYTLGLNLRGTVWFDLLLGVIFLSAIVSAIIAVMQWSGVVSEAGWGPAFILYNSAGGRVSSNIGQANNLGTLLVLGMGAIGYAWYSEKIRGVIFRSMALVSLFVLVFGVYCSGSRAATLNLLFLPLLACFWARARSVSWPKLMFLPALILLLLYFLFPLWMNYIGELPPQEFRSLASDGNRFRLWMMVVSAIFDRPFLGYGFGAVANIHLNYSPEYGSFDYTVAHHAHNTILDMWSVFGLLLGTLIICGVIWLWVKAWLRCISFAHQVVWLMATAMLVHGMVEYPLHYGFFVWLLFLLFGFLVGEKGRCFNFRFPIMASLLWIYIFLTPTLLIWVGYVRIESMYTIYRQEGVDRTYQRIKWMSPSWSEIFYSEPYERLRWATIPMHEVLTLSDINLAALERQASYYPSPTLGWRVAFSYAARGDAHRAEWWAERMCIMFGSKACLAANSEWLRLAGSNVGWPKIHWEKWLPKDSSNQ